MDRGGHLVSIGHDASNGNKPRLRLNHIPWEDSQDSREISREPFAVEQENLNLKQQLVSLGVELEQARTQARGDLLAHNEKTEEAISFQKRSFQETANLYDASTRDICLAEVAHSNAAIEADAFSVINKQREELGNAATMVTHLREHLSAASQQAAVGTNLEQQVAHRVSHELNEHRAAVLQQENNLKPKNGATIFFRDRQEACLKNDKL